MEIDEKEAQIRAKYRKEIEEKVQGELNRIKEAERMKQKEIEAERKAKEAKMSMMEKIRNELNKIRELDNLRNSKIEEEKEKEEWKAKREEEMKIKESEDEKRRFEVHRKKLLQGIQAQRMAEEMKMREEARKLRLENERMRELERRKREQEEEEAKVKALEEEKRRIAEIEYEERQKRIEAQIQARKEEARRVEEKIQARKREEKEREIQRQKDIQEQILKDNEALRKKDMEAKKNKLLLKAQEEKKKEVLPKRNSLQGNIILQKFEQISRNAAEEEARKRELIKKKGIKKMPPPKYSITKDKILKKSQSLFKRLKNNDQKKLSKENLRKSKSKLSLLMSSKLKLSRIDDHEENNNVTKKDMKNYLISQVLFDGTEDVNTREKTPEKEPENYTFFENYKAEMEKYLSLFDEKENKAKRKFMKEPSKKVEPLFTPVNHLKTQFEFPSEKEEKKEVRGKNKKKVGKFKEFKEVFKTEDEDTPKRKSYVPIIIDKEAFERTVGKFQRTSFNNEDDVNKEEVSLNQEDDEESTDLEQEKEEEGSNDMEEDSYGSSSMVEEGLESPDPVNDLRERISLELAKVKETELMFNENIQKENKKKELMRAIQEEISKIKQLSSKKDLVEDDSDNMPEWIKRFQSYKTTEKDMHSSQKEICKSSNKKKKSRNETKDTFSTSLEYQDMIEALLSLSEEDKNQRKSKIGSKSEKRRTSITKQGVLDIKSKYETIIKNPHSENETRPEIKGLNINDVKNSLLSSTDNPPPSKSKMEQLLVLSKTTNNIKNIFESKFSGESKEKILVSTGRRKSTIQVPDVFTSPPENEKKIETESTQKREWIYKQKQMSDLGYFLHKNASILPHQILEQGAQVLSHHNHDQRNDPSIENLADIDAPLLDSVKTYLEKNPEKNIKDSVFMESLRGYLDLIEVDDGQSKEKNKVKSRIQIKLDSSNIRTLQSKILSEDSNNDSRKEPNRIIGKLDGRLFEGRGDKEDKPRRITPAKRLCSEIKDHLEKNNKKEKTPDKITRRKIIVDVIEPNNLCDLRLKDSKNNASAQDWKWKKKDPKELWNENTNTVSSDKEVEIAPTFHSGLQSTEEERRDLIERTQLLADRTKEREKEYQSFLSILRDYSTNEITDGAVSQIESYLQLIDEDPSSSIEKRSNFLPQIDVPWKINKAKDKLIAATAQQRSNTKRAEVGKLGTFKNKISNKTTLDKSNLPSKDLQTKSIHGIKNHFEDIMKNGSKMKKSLSEMNLTPRRRQKTVIRVPEYDPLPAKKNVNNNKWQNKISQYFQSETMNSTPSKSNKKEVASKSKWDAIKDPEERKKAILAKHGVKLRIPNNHRQRDELFLEECNDVGNTIFDEDSYKAYLRERTGMDFDSDEESESKNRHGGSVSSLLNILGSVRKTINQKQSNTLENSSNGMAQSEVDLSQIPGSCSYIRHRFERQESSSNLEPRSHVPKRVIRIPSTEKQQYLEDPPERRFRNTSFDNNHLFKSESSTNLSIRSELDILRSSSSLRRQFSEQNLNSDKLISKRTPSSADLDNEVLEDLSKSNSAIKAMFEASAPKYKFGQKLTLTEDEKSKVKTTKRPENKESRQWVLDSVNKYFDVIVEEEEEKDSDEGMNYSDSEYEEEPCVRQMYQKSTVNMRNMLTSVMDQYRYTSQECMLKTFKRNLGSQLQLKRQSTECLNL